MFGMLQPCRHGATAYGIDPGLWQSHMCGLCLGLRDRGGQVARVATNTDAIVLSLLTEAQAESPAPRRTAGPCPLRGLRTARVPVSASAPVQLAATASLLLGSAEVRDHIDDGDMPIRWHRPMRRIAAGWSAGARARAADIGLDVDPLIAAIEAQAETERRIAAGSVGTADLDDLTVASRRCAAEFFAHTAVLAGRPDNTEPLRTVGAEFGRIAHLADALTDYSADAAAQRFNPLTATTTAPADAYELVRVSDRTLRDALRSAGLAHLPALRWALLDPLSSAVRRLGAAVDALQHGEVTAHHPCDPHSAPPRRPGAGEAIRLTCTQYCTGYACCAEHTNPCDGRRRQCWARRVDKGNCCDCCECGCCDC